MDFILWAGIGLAIASAAIWAPHPIAWIGIGMARIIAAINRA